MLAALLTTLTAGALGLVVAGCGDGETKPGPELTAAEWRRQVNAVCRTVGREVRAVRPPDQGGRVDEFTAAVIPLWDRERNEIKALTPPEQLSRPAAELLTALDYLNVGLVEVHIATQRYDGDRRQRGIERVRAAATGIKLRAAELRLPACFGQRIP